jgi:hypothetical protein
MDIFPIRLAQMWKTKALRKQRPKLQVFSASRLVSIEIYADCIDKNASNKLHPRQILELTKTRCDEHGLLKQASPNTLSLSLHLITNRPAPGEKRNPGIPSGHQD